MLLSLLTISCGGGRRTTVVIVEPDPVQTYTINITRFSALNPVGGVDGLYVKVFNAYNIDDPEIVTSPQTITITDRGDNLPITFQLKDLAGVIYETSVVLTDDEFLSDAEFTLQDGDEPNNSISFTDSIILQTKKQ